MAGRRRCGACSAAAAAARSHRHVCLAIIVCCAGCACDLQPGVARDAQFLARRCRCDKYFGPLIWRASCCCVRSAVVEGSGALSFSWLSAGFVRRASHPIQASTEASVDRPTTLPVQRQSSEADDKTKRTPAYLLPKGGTHGLQASNQASTAAPATGSQLPQHLLQQRKHSSQPCKAAPPARHRRA